jgi:transcriptional regulator with XRE-family HTH domain
MKTLGNKLLHLRQEHKLSQMEVASILNVSQNAYHRWESDKCKPSVDNLVKISQYWHINIIKLLDDNEKINILYTNINDENKFLDNNIPFVNRLIHLNIEILSQVLQTQELISKLLESQSNLIEEIGKKIN